MTEFNFENLAAFARYLRACQTVKENGAKVANEKFNQGCAAVYGELAALMEQGQLAVQNGAAIRQ
jgi:hypothetical protein